MNNNKEIGHKLKSLRLQQHWNQQDIAERMNVTRGTVSNWEIGRRIPDVKTLKQLCKIYNVSIEFFIPTANKNEVEELLARATELFENDNISKYDKIELHNQLVKLYINSLK